MKRMKIMVEIEQHQEKTKFELVIVAAIAANGVIGRENKLPWALRSDMEHFKKVTHGSTILMGRRTWEGIGKPLPDRQNIVLSSTLQEAPRGVCLVGSFEEGISQSLNSTIFVIGGVEVYRTALPNASRMILTHIDQKFDGDVFMPDIDYKRWTILSKKHHMENNLSFSICHYARMADSR